MFWIVAAVLVVVTLAVLLWPLIVGRAAPVAGRAEFDLAVHRDQLAEIERDLARGLFDDAEAEAARTEIRRRALAAAEAAETEAVETEATGLRRRAGLAALAVLIPLGAMSTYMALGAPGIPDAPLASRPAPAATADGHTGDTGNMVARLAAQLERNPGDVQGWLLLARSFSTMERYADAARAYARAIDSGGASAAVRAEYGESLVMAAAGSVPDRAAEIFRAVVAEDPTEPRARFFLGLFKVQRDDLAGALQEWVDLRAVTPPGAPWMAEVEGRIAAAASALGRDPASLAPTPGLPEIVRRQDGPPAGAPPMPSAEDVKAASEMSAEDRESMIRGMVEGLAARLEDQPDDRDGWLRLARAYEVLGEPGKAAEARARAAAVK